MEKYLVNKKLEAIVAGAHAIMEQNSFKGTARQIFDLCRGITGANSGYIAMLNDVGDENEVLFLEAGGMPCSVDPELPMPVRGLRELAYKTHQTVYDNDFMHSEWIDYIPQGHVELRNVMFAPLNLEGKTVGIIGLANKDGDFTPDDADAAQTMGELASIALQKGRYIDELKEKNESLEQAMTEIRTLRGIIPICMYCKGIRDDKGMWNRLEAYLCEHTEAQLSHGICDKCLKEYYPQKLLNQ